MADTSSYLMYPSNLPRGGQNDWVKFEFFKYKPPYSSGIDNDGKSFLDAYNTSVTTAEAADGYTPIALPMPEDVSASYSARWTGRDFGPLAPIGLQFAGQFLSDKANINQIGQNATADLTGKINLSAGGVVPYLGASLVSSVMNKVPGLFGGSVTPNDVLASTAGAILNPNTEVLYQGPDLRTLNMTFKMVARNSTEAQNIKDICKQFKKASLPSGKPDQKSLINVPKTVQITFMHNGGRSDHVSQFKMTALGGVQVNYTPNGVWSTYTDGAPVAVSLSLQFLELKLLYEDDIEGGGY